MIPKIIHCCWFGRNPKPELALHCINSWKKFCPDYEIVEWNEDNFDIQTAPLYVQQAYEEKKWAFVTDYVRLYVLYNQGGIYMDTDVEVLKPLDRFLKHKGFSGFENSTAIPTGIMASVKEHPLIGLWMKEYDSKSFYNEDGTLNTTTNVTYISDYMKQSGMLLNNTLQTVNDFTFYPNDYFCPKNYMTRKVEFTNNTYTIHHFDGSWHTKQEKKKMNEIRRSLYHPTAKERLKRWAVRTFKKNKK